jgi:hypothetical protein
MRITVKELIQKLSEYPQDLPIVIEGYENGFDDFEIKQQQIITSLYPNWYDGKYKESNEGGSLPETITQAITLTREGKEITD